MRNVLARLGLGHAHGSGFVAGTLRDGALVGAAWLGRIPDSPPAVVELCVDGVVRQSAVANGKLVDAPDGVPPEGAPADCGFVLPVDKSRLGITPGSVLRVRIANTGVLLTAPDQDWPLTIEGTTFAGAVERRLAGRTVRGWAFDRSDTDGKPLNVDILADGVLVGTATCRLQRRDVADENSGAPRRCGFSFDLPPALFQKRGFSLDVRIAGTLMSLRNAPLLVSRNRISLARRSPAASAEPLPGDGPVQGSLQRPRGFHVTGWLFDREQPGTTLDVSIYVDGALLVTVPANLRRPHLREATGGWTMCGFRVELPDRVFDGAFHRIDALHAGTGRSLQNSPVTIGGPDLERMMLDVIETSAQQALD